MLKIRTGIAVLSAILLVGTTAQATIVSTTTKEINIAVSKKSGHLLDWSKTSQKIQMVMIESPEEAIEKFTFSIPGCKKDACGGDSSLMMINSRKGKTSGVGAFRVVTTGKRGARNVYRVRVTIVNGEVPSEQTQTEFISNETRTRPTVVRSQRYTPPPNISRPTNSR
jgi:hypothetical protein